MYNQILLEGEVPEELNNGKCVLIYKVEISKLVAIITLIIREETL